MPTPYPDREKIDRPADENDGTIETVADAQLDIAIELAEDGLEALKAGQVQDGAYTLTRAAMAATLGETVADIRDGFLKFADKE